MPARIRYGMAIALSLAWLAAARSAEIVATPLPAIVRSQLVVDDFENATGAFSQRYGELEPRRPERDHTRAEWRPTKCRRSRATGSCLELRYSFASPEDADVNGAEMAFRVDLDDLDASGYDHLAFWLKGDKTRGFNETLKVGFRRPKSDGTGLVEDGTEVVSGVTEEWQRFVIPLNRMSGIRDWTHLRAFFIALESRRARARTGAYFIDDVVLLKTDRTGPTVADEVVAARKRSWEESVGGPEAVQSRVQARLSDWPERFLVDRRSLPRDPREFLMRLARDTWRGLDALTDRENGLPVDHVRLARDSLVPPASRIGDYTNITNVGLRLLSIVAAHELSFLSAEEATGRIRQLLDTLERLETFQGFFFNYYDVTTLERTSNLVSFVDSSWLTAGLVVVRAAFPALYDRCTKLVERENYGFFYDDVKQQMTHGYYVNVPTRSEYHYGLLYTEARLGSLIAIGKRDVPEEHWFRLARTLPAKFDWQRQTPEAREMKTARGHRFRGGTYRWNQFRYVPSWGGSMFEALMPTLVLDEKRHAPRSLGRNGELHTEIQRRYALEVLGYPVWGISPGATPGKESYGEYGVKVLGSIGYPAAAVTPYASALALYTAPDAAMANLQALAERYDVYGDYGFYDSVNPRSGEVAHEYLALDQSMVLIAAANALRDGCIQKRFASDPIVKTALPVIGAEDFFD